MKVRYHFALTLTTAILLAILSLGVSSNALSGFDTAVGDFLRGFSSETNTMLFIGITELGSTKVLIILMAVVSLYFL